MPRNIAAAFDRANRNAVRLLMLLLDRGVDLGNGRTYTGQDFVREWKQGGKEFLEGQWRDTANVPTRSAQSLRETSALFDDGDADPVEWTEMMQGKHEWIPTNMLGYVVEQSLLLGGDIRWAFLADTLRIPTRLVVIHPRKMRHPTAENPLGIHGHVGAVYVQAKTRSWRQQTKSQGPFHDELRDLLRTHLSAARNDLDGFVRALHEHVADWYWRGDVHAAAVACGMTPAEFAAAPCPYAYNSGAATYASWGRTMGDMARTLQEEWKTWDAIIDNSHAAARHLVARPVAFAQLPTAITAASAAPPFTPVPPAGVAHARLMQDVSGALA